MTKLTELTEADNRFIRAHSILVNTLNPTPEQVDEYENASRIVCEQEGIEYTPCPLYTDVLTNRSSRPQKGAE